MATLQGQYKAAIKHGLLDQSVTEEQFARILGDPKQRKAYYDNSNQIKQGAYGTYDSFSKAADEILAAYRQPQVPATAEPVATPPQVPTMPVGAAADSTDAAVAMLMDSNRKQQEQDRKERARINNAQLPMSDEDNQREERIRTIDNTLKQVGVERFANRQPIGDAREDVLQQQQQLEQERTALQGQRKSYMKEPETIEEARENWTTAWMENTEEGKQAKREADEGYQQAVDYLRNEFVKSKTHQDIVADVQRKYSSGALTEDEANAELNKRLNDAFIAENKETLEAEYKTLYGGLAERAYKADNGWLKKQQERIGTIAVQEAIDEGVDELNEAMRADYEAFSKTVGNGFGAAQAKSNYINTQQAGILGAASQLYQETETILESTVKGEEKFGTLTSEILRHSKDKLANLASFGMSDVNYAAYQAEVLKKIANAGAYDNPESVLDKNELVLYNALVANIAAQVLRAENTSHLANAGKLTADMLPFVRDIIIGKGLLGGFSAAAEKGLMRGIVRRIGTSKWGKLLANLGKTGVGLVESTAISHISPSTYQQVFKEEAQIDPTSLHLTDEGWKVDKIDTKHTIEAFAAAQVGMTKELFTETGGMTQFAIRLAQASPLGKYLRKTKIGQIAQMFDNTIAGKLFNQTAYHGFAAELSEEWENTFYDAVLAAMNKDNAGKRMEAFGKVYGEFVKPETQVPMLISFALPAIFGGAVSTGQIITINSQYKKAYENLRNTYMKYGATEEEFEDALNELRAARMNMNIEDYPQLISGLAATLSGGSQEQADEFAAALSAYTVADANLGAIQEKHAKKQRQVQQLIRDIQASEERITGNTHTDSGMMYHVNVNGQAGYVVSGGLQLNTYDNADLPIAMNSDVVTVRMEDGSVKQIAANQLQLLEQPQAAEGVMEFERRRLTARMNNLDRFKVGDVIYMTENGQPIDGNSSRVVDVTDEGVVAEIIDPNGQPNTTVIPHEVAESGLSTSDELVEEGVESVVLEMNNGSLITMQKTTSGDWMQVAPKDDSMTLWSQEDLDEFIAKGGAKIVNGEQAPSLEVASGNGVVSEETGGMEQPTEQPQAEQPAKPYATDEQGNPAWAELDVEQSVGALLSEMEDDKELSKQFAQSQIAASKSALNKANKRKPQATTDLAAFRAEAQAIKQEQQAAQAELSKWENILLGIANYKTAEEQAAVEQAAAQAAAVRAQRKQTIEGVGGTNMAERLAASPRIDGNAGSITAADGTKIPGHYVLVSANALTPSHNPNANFAPSEGYPTVNGQSINDRDYQADQEEQAKVKQVAQTYDGRAITNMPIVSDEGLVYSGNGRTMAGQLAAANGTDGAYTEALMENATQFGFTAEQVESVPNARVVFMTDERLPYNTTTLALFNQNEQQTQSNTASAAANVRKLTPEAVGHIIAAVQEFDTVDAFFGDSRAPFELVNRLIADGIISERDKAAFVDNGRLTATGKDRLTALLFGTAFDEKTIRLLGDNAKVRNSVMRALPQILENKGLGDFSLFEHINNAIQAIYDMDTNKMSFFEFTRQIDIEGKTASDKYTAFELRLVDAMTNGGVQAFRDILSGFNTRAKESAGGQMDLFTGEVLTMEELTKQILQEYEQREANERGGAQPESAESGVQSGNGETVTSGTEDRETTERTPRDNAETTPVQKSVSSGKKASNKTEKTQGSVQNSAQLEQKSVETEQKNAKSNEKTQSVGKNTVFTDEMLETARQRMRSRMNRLNAGIDPEMLADGIVFAGYYVEKGVRKFADFAKNMIAEFGESIRPYLKAFYNGLRDMPEAQAFVSEMDDYASVAAIDVNTITIDEQVQPSANEVQLSTEQVQPKQVSVEGLFNDLNRRGTAKLSDNVIGEEPAYIKNYREIKEQYPDALVLFRAGDFYEVYLEDAQEASKILGITLTNTGNYPLAGFPFHALDSYLPKLVRAGKRVAIAEKVKDKPEVVETVGNQTNLAQNLQESEKNSNFAENIENNEQDNENLRGGVEQTNAESSETLGGSRGESEENAREANDEGGDGRVRALAQTLNNIGDKQAQEEYLTESYFWNDYDSIIAQTEQELSKGKESLVFVSKDGKSVIKLVDYSVYSQTPTDFVRNRVELFNDLFPETAYTIVGVTERNGKLNFVLSQPLIKGKPLEVAWWKAGIEEYNSYKPRLDEMMMRDFGMENYGLDAYQNDMIRVQDLHYNNIIEGEDGQWYVVDAITSYRDDVPGKQETPEANEPQIITDAVGEIKKSTDTRDGSDIWLVNPTDRVSKEEFAELKKRAKAHNGYYSNFKQNRGFLFRTEEDAIAFNRINENELTTDEVLADTGLVIGEAETRRNEAETIAENTRVEPSAPTIGEAIEQVTKAEQQINAAMAQVDEATEQVNDQLMLLGYYESESDANEWGLSKKAEKAALKDVNKVANQLAKDLGVEGKIKASANIAPAGGDITFRIPLQEGRELYVDIPIAINGYGMWHDVNGDFSDLYIPNSGKGWFNESILYRVETPEASGVGKYGTNYYANAKTTYNDFLNAVRSIVKEYLPERAAQAQEQAPSQPTVEEQPQELQTPLEKAKARQAKQKKAEAVQPAMGDLFAGTLFAVNEIEESINQQNTQNNENEQQPTRRTGSSKPTTGNVRSGDRQQSAGVRSEVTIQEDTRPTDGGGATEVLRDEREESRSGLPLHAIEQEQQTDRKPHLRFRYTDEYGVEHIVDATYYILGDTYHLSESATNFQRNVKAKDVLQRLKKGIWKEIPLPEQSPEPIPDNQKKNKRNNNVKRGVDYAPKTAKERFEANVAAIQLLKELEESGKQATPAQMKVLRKFTGWGGLGEFFKETYWAGSDTDKLKKLLTPEEYDAANLSRNSAYFTPGAVIDRLWDIAAKFGFQGGNITEGSAGTGEILARIPQAMNERSDILAVEIDPITGGILKQLYPDARVEIDGFQNVSIPNGSQDLVITNVPFVRDLRVFDKEESDLSKRFTQIQDFCIAKNIRKLREGGLGIFIAGKSSLDSSKDLRKWIVKEGNCDVVGAFRLNKDTFNGTSATADIIVVKKRVNGVVSPNAIDILDVETVKVDEIEVDTTFNKKTNTWEPVTKRVALAYNQHYVQHPEDMGGEMALGKDEGDTRFGGGSSACYPRRNINQMERLDEWIANMGKGESMMPAPVVSTELKDYEFAKASQQGQIVLNSKGEICIADRGMAVPMQLNSNKVKGQSKEQVVKDYIALKEAVNKTLYVQLTSDNEADLQAARKTLNAQYDSFVKKYGYLNKNTALSFLRNDVEYPSIAAIEKYEEIETPKGKEVKVEKTDIFKKRVIGVKSEPTPTNTRDAVVLSVQQFGRLDLAQMAQWLNMSEEAVREDIVKERLGFVNPETQQLQIRHEYLSGNVRQKLAYAQAHNENGEYTTNIEELQKVIPMDIPAHLIEFSLGSTWIDPKMYEDFVRDKYGVTIKYSHIGGVWSESSRPYYLATEKNRAAGVHSDLLNMHVFGNELFLSAMNNVPYIVSKKETYEEAGQKKTRTITDKAASQACATRIDEIRDEFTEWARQHMQQDAELAQRMERVYNDKFNAIVPMDIDEQFTQAFLPGMNPNTFPLYPIQQKAIVRGTMQPVLLAHEVGTGKTRSLICTAMEMRRLGTAKKPLIVVQNATVMQFVNEAKELFPNAKVLTVNEKDRTSEGRREFYAKIKYNDWDMVIIPQSVFEKIPDSDERKYDFIQEKVEEKLHVLEQAREADMDSRQVKKLEGELESLREDLLDLNLAGKKQSKKDSKKEQVRKETAEARAEEMLARKTDDVADFDHMGIDALLVDEVHNYKHLGFATMMQRGVKGIDPSYAKKSAGLYLKVQSVFEQSGGKNVVFATGTPISNTAAEIWTFMKYLMPKEVMQENDIYYFDDFVRNFGKISQSLEFATNGKFKENTRFASYVNIPELARIWGQITDTRLSDEVKTNTGKTLKEEKIPTIEGGKQTDIFLEQSDSLVDIMNAVRSQLEEYENMSGAEKKEHSYIPLTMYGIAKRAAIDPRLVDATAKDEPESKTNKAVEETLRALKDSKKYNGTVAIFCDSYRRMDVVNDKRVEGFNIFEEIRNKLIQRGVPADQIVIMKSDMTDKAKQQVFDAMNAGSKRVILGSTQTLGTGVNIQTRLFTLIHMDAPDRPMDMTQREGRILRQGNMHKIMGIPVRILRFGVKDSLDVTGYQRLQTKSRFIDSIMRSKDTLNNNQEGRVIEEDEEGLYDNPVAVLSGSQYALLKSQAEREYRKLLSKQQQHNADQIYIENQLRNNALYNKRDEDYVADSRKRLAEIEKLFPNGKPKAIVVNGVKTTSNESLEKAVKEYNKTLYEQQKQFEGQYNYGEDKRDLKLTVSFDGTPFDITIELKKRSEFENGQRKVKMEKRVFYSCTPLNIEKTPADNTVSLQRVIEEIRDKELSGIYDRQRVEAVEQRIARRIADNEEMQKRRGKQFELTEELAAAKKRVDEYTELMRQELAEQEAKYANRGTGAAVDLEAARDTEGDSSEAEMMIVDSYDDAEAELTEAQQLIFDGFAEVAADAGIDIVEVSEEEALEALQYSEISAEIEDIKANAERNGTYLQAPNGEDTKLTPHQWLVVRTRAFKEWFGDWENDADNASKIVDENGEPMVVYHGTIKKFNAFETSSHGMHFGTIKSAQERLADKRIELRSSAKGNILSVFLNIRNPEETLDQDASWGYEVKYAKLRGADGLTYTNRWEDNGSTSYVAFSPNQIKSATNNVGTFDKNSDNIELLTNPINGKILGYAQGNRIVLTREGMNPETMVHEYTHVWAKAMQRNNRAGWENIKEIFKQSPLWDHVKNDPNYKDRLTTDDAICSEVLARFSGKQGAERLNEVASEFINEEREKGGMLGAARVRQFINHARQAIKSFWKWVGKNLFGITKFDSMEDVADRVLYDLLNATKLDVDTNDKTVEADIERPSAEFVEAMRAWNAANPYPTYTEGESLGAFSDRLTAWKEARDAYRAELWRKSQEKIESADPITEPMVAGSKPVRKKDETPLEYAQRLKQWQNAQIDSQLSEEYTAEMNRLAGTAERAKRAFVDAALPIEEWQNWLIERGATMTSESNAYQDMFLAQGRVSNAAEELRRDIIQKLTRKIAAIIESKKLDDVDLRWHNMDVPGTKRTINGNKLSVRELIGVYCQAKDCEEAEEKGLPDRGKAGFKNNLNVEYTDIVNAVETRLSREDITELWYLINRATKYALDYDLVVGRISRDTYDEFADREYYVPQRGWRERDESGLIEEYEPVGKRGHDPYNAALVKARGRQSLAADPFAYIMSIDHSSIVSSENNKIKQKMLQFCLDNEEIGLKTGAFRVKKYWLMHEIDPDTGKIRKDEDGVPITLMSYTEPKAEDFKHDKQIKDEVRRIEKEIAKRKKALEKELAEHGDTNYAKALQRAIANSEAKIEDLNDTLIIAFGATNTHISQRTRDEKLQHEVQVMKDGQRYVIELQDEKVANAINKKFKQHQEALFNVSDKMRNATRFMSAMLTQYNPEFAASNFVRDFQVAVMTLANENPKLLLGFAKNFILCQRTVMAYAFADKVKDRTKYVDSDMGGYLREYMASGAPTGFSYMQDLKTLRKDFDSMVNEGKLARGVRSAAGIFSMFTEISETAVRFAAYVSAREAGWKINDAAYMSKELTTNFDRAGEKADAIWMSWFSFMRATINGNVKFFRAFKKLPIAYSITAAVYFAMGLINQFANPNDPDDEVWASDYVRENNFVIGKWRIPAAHFMRIFYSAGVNMASWMQGERTFGHAVYNSSMSAFNEILPNYMNIPGAFTEWSDEMERVKAKDPKAVIRELAPTPISPFVDVWANRNFMGGTINREPFVKTQENTKDILMAKDNTLPIYRAITEGIYTAVGGDLNSKYKSDDNAWTALFDVSGSSLEHITEGYLTGGMDMLATTANMIYDAVQGNELTPDKITFIRKFYNQYTPQRAYDQQYWLLKGRVQEYQRKLNDYEENNPDKYELETRSKQYKAYEETNELIWEKIENPTAEDVKQLMEANKQWTKKASK